MTSFQLAGLTITALELEKQILERAPDVNASVTTQNEIVFELNAGLLKRQDGQIARFADWSDVALIEFATYAPLLVNELGNVIPTEAFREDRIPSAEPNLRALIVPDKPAATIPRGPAQASEEPKPAPGTPGAIQTPPASRHELEQLHHNGGRLLRELLDSFIASVIPAASSREHAGRRKRARFAAESAGPRSQQSTLPIEHTTVHRHTTAMGHRSIGTRQQHSVPRERLQRVSHVPSSWKASIIRVLE